VTAGIANAGATEGLIEGDRRIRVAMVAWMVAGVQTQYQHLKKAFPSDRFEIVGVETRPYVDGGWLERLPIPNKPRGHARSLSCLLPMIWSPSVDAVWSQLSVPMLPYVVTRAMPQDIPLFFAVDSTPALYAGLQEHYTNQTDPATLKGRISGALHRLFYQRCTGLLPWSQWVADSMINDFGAPPERMHVVHPGVDTARWHPDERRTRNVRPQLIFVGADFARKGGPLLLDVYRAHLRDRCDLHLVTRADIAEDPGVHVYRDFLPDDDRLLRLYQSCDALVLPTMADMFSMASIEAMACGIPVVVSAVGGIPEIVTDGHTGRLVPPGDGPALAKAIDSVIVDIERGGIWGRAAREDAIRRFSTVVEARQVAGLIEDAVAARNARKRRG
jgi:glycosyltransferase involved in cell wall biosynthesis